MVEDALSQLLPLLRVAHGWAMRLSGYADADAARRVGDYLRTAELTSIAALLVIAYLSTLLVGMATRWVLGVVRLFVRLALLLAVVLAGVWCWQVGVEEAVVSAVHAGSEARGRWDELLAAREARGRRGGGSTGW